MIMKKKGKFLLMADDGSRPLGTHDTFQKAIKQQYAVTKSQGKSKEEIQRLIDEEVKRHYKTANKHMSFPRSETSQLRERLNSDKPIFTTRVDAEKGKYKLHDLVNSRLGKLRVTEVRKITKLNAHPFLSQLTEKNKKDIGDNPMDFLKLEKVAGLTHYQHGDSVITPSLSQLASTNPDKANEVMQRLIAEGYRKPGYLDHRDEVEMLLRMQAANLGIDAEGKYPVYATLGKPTDKTIFRGESSVNLPLDVLKDRTTFTIGDSFRVLGKTPDGNARNLAFPTAMSYEDVQRVMQSPEMKKQLKRSGKGGYIEAQIWDDANNLEKLVKTSMVRRRSPLHSTGRLQRVIMSLDF